MPYYEDNLTNYSDIGGGARRSDGDHYDLVRKKVELYEYLVTLLLPRWEQEVTWERRYNADTTLVDTRDEDEKKWRSLLMLPYGFSGIQALVANLVDQLMSASPLNQVRGRGPEDTNDRALERVLNYTFGELNDMSEFSELTFTRGCLGGMDIWKLSMRNQATEHFFKPRPQDEVRFREAVTAAQTITGLPAPLVRDPRTGEVDRVQWRKWVDQVRSVRPDLRIPAIPVSGRRLARGFQGPYLRSLRKWDTAYDPTVARAADQHCMFHRMVMRKADLIRMAEAEPEKFDIEAIQNLGGRGAYRETSELQQQINESLGLAGNIQEDDPYFRDAIEVLEFRSPEDDLCYGWIANRCELITTKPEEYPEEAREQPYSFYYNVPSGDEAVGIGEYQQLGMMHDAADKLLMSQVDLAQMQALAPLKRKKGWGLANPLPTIQPGVIVDVEDNEDLTELFDFSKTLQINAQALQFFMQLHDQTQGTFDSLRGAPAEQGRVSATESQGRASAMMARVKGRLYRFGSAMKPMHRLACALWKQFGEHEMLENIAGLDPFLALSSDVLESGLRQDYVFIPSTVSNEASMQVQQLTEMYTAGMQSGLIKPGGQAQRLLFAKILQARRTPGADDIMKAIITDAEQAQAAPPPAPAGQGAPQPPAEAQAPQPEQPPAEQPQAEEVPA